jgi:hypothetical protein
MRWLMIALLVSLGALLLAAAGLARHIWLRRAKIRSKPTTGTVEGVDPTAGQAEETDVETEI